ncbi:beta-1,3-galactosyl-O-glycosyl-glycoprotein beta-1,6-N-acetylglucosaminyltransferase [Lingula anatina]|uniref:Beta-1,3-galactosyl-O-glycosyl-glycoprotein beta-1,6-N-acetylglucosaminyltransferase n=1 Tax=Lingula anatina TaxID=7574 RepID=A0A1S3H993_LINAN|nr:beta-1,3-galactosyl-O-glycosyl-glycoprotein beta-1,6-N-acetylglucosaminyltransferase [Lingula anatina]|eukprot:XP_013381699.1 beta-1,3-galactosyl-O-glycosyl-glycoprotein beta-1,6-N-acetylglucosaminyltransferase [Lingula anatina]
MYRGRHVCKWMYYSFNVIIAIANISMILMLQNYRHHDKVVTDRAERQDLNRVILEWHPKQHFQRNNSSFEARAEERLTPTLDNQHVNVTGNFGGKMAQRTTTPPNNASKNIIRKVIKDFKVRTRKLYSFNCLPLIRGDKNAVQSTLLMLRKKPYIPATDEFLESLTHSEHCKTFKFVLGYADAPLSVEEAEFPIAYSIKLHQSAAQVERLLRNIYMPQNVYCIYVDKKSPQQLHKAMKNLVGCFENVFFASHVEEFIYASSSQMMADIQCMRDLAEYPVNWKYHINLAGQEFPLKTNLEIVKVLKLFNGTNDIETYVDRTPNQTSKRYFHGWTVKDGRMYKPSYTKKPANKFEFLWKGSAYNLFSREFVDFILTDPDAITFIDWLHDTYAPEEAVWATLNRLPKAPGGYQSPIEVRHDRDTHASRAVIWMWDRGVKCHGMLQRGVCVFSVEDLPWLLSKPQLFANKFYLEYDPILMECLEEVLENRTKIARPELFINWQYYNNLPHIKNELK